MVLNMTIRPVDLQVIIPRVTEVSKTQHTMNQQETLQQQQFEGKWQQISAKREHQVQGTKESEASRVKEKHAKEQNRPKDGKKQGDDKKGTDHDQINHPSHEDPIRGNLIDIKT